MARRQQFGGFSLAGLVAAAWVMPAGVLAGPYPALPVTSSISVDPNVMLHIDNSGSMDDRPAGSANNAPKKMTTAKAVAKDLIQSNQELRWGLFAFDENNNDKSGVLLRSIEDSTPTNIDGIKSKIDSLSAETWTPLGEAMLEITAYFAGSKSYYSKISKDKNYSSPIQYRCQKNFAIVITDGQSTKDDTLPGLDKFAAIPYTAQQVSAGAYTPVTRNFRVCTDTKTSSSVTCPEQLPYNATTNQTVPFVADSSYIRSLRDVAMYAQDRDFKVGGVDGDSKSWDDPAFPTQNLITYTVAFDIADTTLNRNANAVLYAAAKDGGGKYFTASNEAELKTALQTVIDSINKIKSNAGGVAVIGDSGYQGNRVFQPIYNTEGWYGELRCKTLDDSSGLINGSCSTPKAIVPASDARKIFTSKQDGSTGTMTTLEFKAGAALAPWQQRALDPGTATVNTATVNKVINYIRGAADTDYRTRPTPSGESQPALLGDMVGAQPVVVDAPFGSSSDAAYATFKMAQKNRSIVFVGANDGMMHAFDGDTMQELMGYVPATVYPQLPLLTKKDYGLSTGTPHNWYVNGNARQADVRLGATTAFDSGWKTILVAGLAQGGQGYFALDATDNATVTSAATVKWEFNDRKDADMGYSFGSPLIYNVRTSATTVTPVVILANGYKSSDANSYGDTTPKSASDVSALYILNADSGTLLKKIAVTGGAGLSSPAGVDLNRDGILDYVYAGDMNGKMWRFDLTANQPASFKVETTPIFNAGSTHPIVMRPAIMPVADGNLVLFGTGKLQEKTDQSDTTTQTFYAVLDKVKLAPVTASTGDLVKQEVLDTVTNTTVTITNTYRKLSDNAVNLTTKRGWYLDLPDSGERLLSSPLLLKDKLLFATGSPVTEEKCTPGGTGWVMGINPLTGGVAKNSRNNPYSFIDTNGDKKSTPADMLAFSKDKANDPKSYVSGVALPALPSELTFLQKDRSYLTPHNKNPTFGDAGNSIALQDANRSAIFTGDVPSGSGQLFIPLVGKEDLSQKEIQKSRLGAKVETTLWWEVL